MKLLRTFSLRAHEGPQSSRGLESELLLNGDATGKRIPGYILEAQYCCQPGYLFITSWDCGDDSLDVVLTNGDLHVLDRKSIGAMYDSTRLESHEVLSENEVLLHCDNNFSIRVTAGSDGLFLHQRYGELKEFIPYPSTAPAKKTESKPWWKFW
jgi:hypothetical protein